MHPNRLMALRTLIADPDRPDRDALFAVLDNWQTETILSCLAPPGSLLQIATALLHGWLWCLDGWERQTDKVVGLITDPRCPSPSQMIETWRNVPSAVGILRDRTAALIAWAQQRLDPEQYADLAILLGPSDKTARLLVQSPFSDTIGRTLRCWSMATDPTDPTAWQAMIESPDLRAVLHQRADLSWAFPAWGGDDAVDPGTVLDGIVDDLAAGWSPDHPSIRGRIVWLEHHVNTNLEIGSLAFLASIGRSDALAETVCVRLGHDPASIPRIAEVVPWGRLHPRIQTVIDTTMRRSSNDRWTRTWACAIGQAPVERDTTIDSHLLLWRIEPERWETLDASLRAALVDRISYLPDHCYGWGIHPDLVEPRFHLYGNVFRFWNPNVPSDDLRAWRYADLLRAQSTLQAARDLIALLAVLSPTRHARFDQIIDWQFDGRFRATAQSPWDWTTWNALPAVDRQTTLATRLSVLWGDRTTWPAVRCWRARNDGLATVAMTVGEMLGLDDPVPILAALLAQVLGLRGDTTDVGSLLPFPDDLDAAWRAQIERLPLDRDAQAYAAWCLWVLARRADVGADLIAFHPTVAVALAPVLTTEQRAMVTASPAAQGWESITHLHWDVACAAAEEPTTPPIQRRIR